MNATLHGPYPALLQVRTYHTNAPAVSGGVSVTVHVPPPAQPACSAVYHCSITSVVSPRPSQNWYHVAVAADCQVKAIVEPVTSDEGVRGMAGPGCANAGDDRTKSS